MEYHVRKRKFSRDDIEEVKIFFDNGDCFSLARNEIVDFSVCLYDDLILNKNYWNSFCAIVESGFLKLKLVKKPSVYLSSPFLYNKKEYNKGRINYIKNRLLEQQDDMVCFQIFDSHNWYFTFYCQVKNTIDGELIILNFLPCRNKSYNSQDHSIFLPEISKSLISAINLDFENCEGILLDSSEIIEINLNLNKELCWGSGDYVRSIKNGYLKIKFDKELNVDRENNLFSKLFAGEKGNKQMERRICGKKGYALHDICHLYLTYDVYGAGIYRRECIEIEDVRSEEEFKAIADWERENECEFYPCFVGGYAEKQEDGSILIVFGNANKYKNYNNLLNKCSVKSI